MRLKSYLTAVTLGVFLSACASTENVNTASSDSNLQTVSSVSNSETARNENEVVCKTVSSIGTNMKKRSCKTLKQIRREQESSQRALSDVSRAITSVDEKF